MSEINLKSIIEECVKGKTRLRVSDPRKKRETYNAIWKAINGWIESRFFQRLGVSIPKFGKIGWEKAFVGKPKLRPTFQIADTFCRAFDIKKPGGSVAEPNFTACEDLNFTKIAIRFSQNLVKDDVFTGFRDIFQTIGKHVANFENVTINFGVGDFKAKERKISFVFDQHQLRAHGCKSTVGSASVKGGDTMSIKSIGNDTISILGSERPLTATSIRRSVVPCKTGTENNPLTREVLDSHNQESKSKTDKQTFDGRISTFESDTASIASAMTDISINSAQTTDSKQSTQSSFSQQSFSAQTITSALLDDADPVLADAYKRQLQKIERLAKQTKFEKEQMERNYRRSLAAAQLKKQKQREKNMNVQKEILRQMKERMVKEEEVKKEEQTDNPAYPPLYDQIPVPEGGTMPFFFEPPKDKKKQQELSEYLKNQMREKEEISTESRHRELDQERQFLGKVHNEMHTLQQEKIWRKQQIANDLQNSWARDRLVKEALHASVSPNSMRTPRRDSVHSLRNAGNIILDITSPRKSARNNTTSHTSRGDISVFNDPSDPLASSQQYHDTSHKSRISSRPMTSASSRSVFSRPTTAMSNMSSVGFDMRG
eukprot:TRINITY_DN775822_c0_g1_i1.p1 TRINITY_DN775822_c0_g1~~TRINITY_DN775822_c0_g1_i1.p1  ORF type:complete len:601 (+),score=170.70 TRINITY_DN775822_c0_g1_i1:112-1914(+)